MRKLKLLIAACALLLGGSNALAQETPKNDGVYYMYNESTGLFLTRGENWGTRAVARSVAMPWKVSIADGKYTLRMYDITVAGGTGGFGSDAFSDNGSPLAFTPDGNAADGFTLKNGDNYITCPDVPNNISLSTTASSWQFLTQAQYDAVLAAKVAAQEAAIASAKGITIPSGQTLNDVVSDADNWTESATVNDGVPTSSTWTSSKHSGRGGTTNWHASYGSEMYQCGNAHYTRTISGLKKGIYKVAVRGMKRMGNNATCTTMGNAGYPVSDTYLSANGYIIRIKAWYENRASDENPNNTDQFVSIVNNGGYISEGFVYVGDDGKMELDASSEAYWGGSWFLFNGISYTYFNNEVSDDDITALVATIPAEVPTVVATNLATLKSALENQKTIAAYNDLTAAIAAANPLVAPYAAYLVAASDAQIVGVAATTINEQNVAVNEATTIDGINACTEALRTAIAAFATFNITDYTIQNPTAQTKDNWDGTDFGGQSNNVCEYWNKSGADFHQTINLPAGKYCLTVIALQRTDMTGTVYANEKRTIIAQVASSVVNNRQQASAWFNDGNGVNTVYFELAETSDVVIGLTTDATTSDHWTVWKSFQLETLTETVAASYLKPDYEEAMAAAVAYQSVDMFDEDKTALITAITENTVEEASATIAAYETAIANLNAAAAAAAKAVANYITYNNVVAAIGENTNVDLTEFVTNADFETQNLEGWISEDGGNIANNGNFNNTYFVERWNRTGYLPDGSLTHEVIVLPAGVYRITADAQNIQQHNGEEGVAAEAGTGLFLCANAEQAEIGAKGNYAVYIKVADKTPLTIKFLRDNCTGNWVAYDNVTLTYINEDYIYTLVDGKMNATVAAAQTAAETAFTENQNGENYQALMTAIAAAQASKDAYATAGAAIANANALKEAHNFATADAITTFADAIAAIETPYNENTLADDAAANAGITLGTLVTGWHSGANTAAVVYMNDGFSLTPEVWEGLYVNTWSTEGESDGSNFKVPFYEYFGGANTMTATLTGLENGLYSVSALVRVETTAEDVADATGITIDVNGGTAVDATVGEQIGESKFKLGTFTAEGLVKDGTLTFNVNKLEGSNINWLSFKNIKYTKVRDLIPEEMLVAPTAITLMNGETAVTEPIALDAENLTVTLTPAYEPANASEGYVEWTTSDASVATVENGVVTAVSTGTATITATSTIDGEVSASATVNVTFPESEFASTQTIVNDNDTRSTLTLGANLIKNGSFEYPTNPVFGWTTGTGSVNAMNAANFNIVPEGAFNGNQYLQATASKGGADEHSINTSWPIEKGKKYVFSFMIKANKQCTTDLNYIGVSITNAKGNEASDKVPGVKFDTPAYGTEWQEIKHVFENDAENGYSWLVFNSRWLANQQSFDNFYLCEVIDETTTDQVTDEEAAALLATVPTGKMNAETLTALTTAKEAFEANKSIANSKALSAAITAAEASVTAYAPLGAAIAKIDAALDAATTATASADDYDAVKTAYNNGTIADADILTNVANAYNAAIPVIKSQTAAQADFTLAIQNQSFEYGDMTGWSAASSSDTGVRETSNATYAAAGSDGYYLFNTWWQGVPVSQTISDLPNGEYTLTASVASDGATVYLVANGEHNDGTETYAETNYDESQYGKDVFQEATITFLVKQGSVTIAAVGGAGGDAGVHKDYVEEGYWWYKADNFRLVKNRDLTSEEEFVAADEADYEHLNGVLAKYALGFQAGEFAPYNNLALVQAIAAAKAIDQTAVNSQEDVQAAAEAITSAGGIANETEVNAVYDGTFAAAVANSAPAGWTMSNNTLGGDYHSRVFNGDERLSEFNETNSALFIRFDGTNSDRGSQYFYGNTEGYTMPLKANTYYRVTVDFAGWGSTGKTLRMNLKGPDGFAKSQEYKHEHKADTESGYTPQQFNIVFQTGNTEGNYVIGFQCPGNDNNKHNAVISNLRLFTEPESSATLAVTDAKYGTFIAPFAVEIPNGVTAYTIESSNGNELVLTEVESDDIAANTPVVVFSENEVNEVFNGYSLAIKDSYTVGWLTGTYEDIDAPDGKYIMQKQNDKVGFYHVDYAYLEENEMAKPKVKANRAYLTAPAGAEGARAFFFDGGETTGISAIEALANGDAQIFNVNGVQQPRLMKGLNIIVTKDGKTHKVMVK